MKASKELTAQTKANKIRKINKHLDFTNKDGIKTQSNCSDAIEKLAELNK